MFIYFLPASILQSTHSKQSSAAQHQIYVYFIHSYIHPFSILVVLNLGSMEVFVGVHGPAYELANFYLLFTFSERFPSVLKSQEQQFYNLGNPFSGADNSHWECTQNRQKKLLT